MVTDPDLGPSFREYSVHNGDREENHLANLDHQQVLIRNEGLLGYNVNN